MKLTISTESKEARVKTELTANKEMIKIKSTKEAIPVIELERRVISRLTEGRYNKATASTNPTLNLEVA